MKKLSLAILALTLVGFFSSCEKTDTLSGDVSYDETMDENYVSEIYDEVEDVADEALNYYDETTSMLKSGPMHRWVRLSECVTVTKDSVGDAKVITIDFGEENCLGQDGRYRRGKIIVNHYGCYWDDQAEINYSFENFFVDDNQIVGTKNVVRTRNEHGYRHSHIEMNGEVILANGEGKITRTATRERLVIQGSDTRAKWDDVIEITGNSTTTLADGTVMTCQILTPLVRMNENECRRYFVEGTKSIIVGDEAEKIIDYGDGTCDNIATVTQNGETWTIELGKRGPRF